ncbi:MAG: lipid-A-disaccharide synthase [Candidatus Kapabacteria bacterium]|nr:lipid-A-disaccharide synthase [Candidatus Kapabacteria bacterium]MCS7169686.1 lipid-A-disaccharide synthase [Candidatus Kapabacteria bacterium]MDW7996406.1 lipid-A-disaccharide synthase [Bacteroidota bacterium]MDW8224868.1 lipid-A-disaccharide synthase [Bacteroidota bacterium]
MGRRIFLVAGDPSGERYAARLMAAWRQLEPTVEFFGIGGPQMEDQGLHSLTPLHRVSVVGFWEVVRRYGFFRRLLKLCEATLQSGSVSAVVLVDYPGFNLRLAEHARRAGIPVYYYIAPQVWAWGRWRLQTLARTVSLLLVAFPFELELFQHAGIRCAFVGHPLMDEPQLAAPPSDPEHRPFKVALLPGSRPQELRHHLPLLRQVVWLLERELSQVRFYALLPPALPWDRFPDVEGPWEWQRDAYTLLLHSRAGLVKLGTSTLEAALCGMPFAAFYRTSWVSYTVARALVQLPSAVMVNLLLGGAVVPEFLQSHARPAALARAVMQLLEPAAARRQWEHFLRLRTLLGEPGVAQRAAALIAEHLSKGT